LKFSVIYNLLGSLFDKGLPIIISVFLTKYMTVNDYGVWSLFFQFILIINSLCTTPLTTIFSRSFFKNKEENPKIKIFNLKDISLLFLVATILFYSFFAPININILVELPALVCLALYTYLGLYFRFKKEDKKYFLYSLLRLGIFSVGIWMSIFFTGTVSYRNLIILFIVCHIPSLLVSFKNMSFTNNETKDKKDFYSLAAYGLSTSLVSGLDKFVIIAAGFSINFLAFYSFIYTLTNAPTIIIEALKKTIQPTMYKELSESEKISTNTIKKILIVIFVILIVQFSAPIILFRVLEKLNLINSEFLHVDDTYIFITILSIGAFFQAMYHFINPIQFYFKKSNFLLYIQGVSLVLYMLFVYIFASELHYMSFMWLKTGVLILVTVLTFNHARKLHLKQVL